MNTIPTTSKRMRIPYTVVGAKPSGDAPKIPASLSLIILNRGGRPYKSSTFAEIESLGFREVLSIEGPSAAYDIENLSGRFPFVKFLILSEDVTIGERINMAIAESNGRYNLVIWNDQKCPTISTKLIRRIDERDALCTVPVLQNTRGEVLPTIQAPAFYNKQLRVVPLPPLKDKTPSVYPFDYCGIYNKERFTLTGGYDFLLSTSYWQKLDFGFRAFMWGEQIICDTAFRINYYGDVPSDDTTREQSYKLFYLKNLAVRFSRDSGVLPRGTGCTPSTGPPYCAWCTRPRTRRARSCRGLSLGRSSDRPSSTMRCRWKRARSRTLTPVGGFPGRRRTPRSAPRCRACWSRRTTPTSTGRSSSWSSGETRPRT